MAIDHDPGKVQARTYAERLGHLGRILDEGSYRHICVIELDSDLIARACSTPGREVEMIELPVSAVNPSVAEREGKRGRYQALLSGIGAWFDRRGASNIVMTEGDSFMAVGGFAPYEAGDSDVMKGRFEELLLRDELAELARLGGASGTVAASIGSNGVSPEAQRPGSDGEELLEGFPARVRQLGGRFRRLASGVQSKSN